MFKSAGVFASRNVVRFVLTGSLGIWLSGCSADMTRFGQAESSPFANPFASNAEPAGSAPVPKVTSQPLSMIAPNPGYAAPAHPSPVAMASLPPAAAPESTGQIRAPASVSGGAPAGWSAVGGTPIVVAGPDTLEILSRRYGVPTEALLRANGFESPREVHAGVHMIIPVYNNSARTASAAPEPMPIPTAGPHPRHGIETRDAESLPTKLAPAKAKKKKIEDDDADASDVAPPKAARDSASRTKVVADAAPLVASKPIDLKTQATRLQAGKAPADKSKPAPLVPVQAAAAKAPAAPAQLASARPAAPDTTPTGRVAPAASTAPVQTAAQADDNNAAPEFRWPARGRIIQGFKSGGNDGINIAVPEGTSVRAAESGVVAYSGSGLKGYGNLVLIKHPNGFVSAYANNGELDVKMGDTVKRGQIIAKSGQSGDVSTPQLHFELRKGTTPVDPTAFLAGL